MHNDTDELASLRLANDAAAAAWITGYGDGFNGRDVREPKQCPLEYLRGYVAGIRALKH
jgi:hypothetical protein